MQTKRWIIFLSVIFIIYPTSLLFPQTGQVLTFSEVMFRPSENNGEFIEIYNTSTTETIDLTNFKIKYYTSTADNLVGFIGGMLLAPGKFAVVIENDYDWNNGVYKNMIPADAIVLKTADNSFGTSGMANTTSRDINLINLFNQTVDTYTYSADNSEGISDEKYILNKDNADANWKNSTVSHGTPGKKNSVSPVDYDLRITFFGYTPATPTAEDSLRLTFVVKNLGRLTTNNFLVELFNDVNSDTLGQPAENIFTRNYTTLASDDSLIIQKSFFPTTQGSYRFLGTVTFAQDEVTSNNKALTIINVAEKLADFNDIVINEIMYAPSGDEPEWIEIFNKSNRTINLKNWRIGDASTLITISSSDYLLNSQEYLVIAKESTINNYYNNISKLLIRSIPSLNNSGDDVILKDLYNRKIDSLKYLPSWGGSSGIKSLERISANAPSTQSSNWGTSISPNRATPGRINSLTSKNNDLAVKTFTSNSTFAQIGSSIILRAEIQNLGLQRADNFQVNLFHDINLDQIADAGEIINTTNILSLDSGQINLVEFNYQNFAVGNNQFIAVINLGLDEYTDNNTSYYNIIGVAINEVRGDLVINEIMYAPTSTEPEWIEIFNPSTKSINMMGYKISDDATTTRVINQPLTLNPNEYLVVAKDSSITNVHGSISILRINTFASLNNSGDRVVLLDSLNRVIDSLDYKSTWGGTNGKSLERINAAVSSIDSTNWKTSSAVLGSTPGRFNSATPYDNDLSVSIISHSPSSPIKNDSVTINIRIDNIGKNTANNFELEIFNDMNLDSIAQPQERFLFRNYTSLNSGQSISHQAKFFAADVRSYRIIAIVNYSVDEVQSNNTAVREFNVLEIPASTNEIVINEIMYAPTNDEPEWIEIYNRSNRVLNLKDWKIGDNTALATISTTDLQLNPGEFLIISNEAAISNFYNITSQLIIKSLPSLGNTGDDVMLRDNMNRTIDSLKYLPSWGGTFGNSLERKNVDSSSVKSSNWGTSISMFRATPGLKNSITPRTKDLAIKNFKFNNKYVYDNNSAKASFWIINNGTEQANQFQYKIYNDFNNDGNYSADELINEGSGNAIVSRDSLKIEFIPSKYNLGENIIYVLIEFSGDENLENNSATAKIIGMSPTENKFDLVINEIMYAPNSPEPEWIEIFNRSGKTINLKGYQIADDANKVFAFKTNYLFDKDSYAVISRDSNIVYYYSGLTNIITSAFPTLNNSGDRLILLDSLNRAIDSLTFKSSWGGTSGKSLERIDVNKSSTDSTNWKTTTAIRGTPGKINSRSKKDYNVALILPSITPKNPKVGQSVNINTAYWNHGKNTAVFTIKLFEIETNGKKSFIKEKLVTMSPTSDVIAYLTELEYVINNLTKTRLFEYYADYPQDEDTTDNRLQIRVRPGYNSNMVLINEIMYNPANGEPEWIELYNNSNYEIDFEDWNLSDVLTTPQTTKLKRNLIAPKSYVVITKDSTIAYFHKTIPSKIIVSLFANLNNDADGVVIKDSHGTVIDSLLFDKSWGGENGKSLERKLLSNPSNNKNNWDSSIDIELSTPGRMNSITPYDNDLAIIDVEFTPIIATSSDDVNLYASVFNKGLNTAQNFSVEFYFVNGNDTTYFSVGNGYNLSAGDTINILSASKTKFDNPKKVHCKLKFALDEFSSNNSFTIELSAGFKKNSIVISEIMYNPFDGESEWIEISNTTNTSINLKGWKVSDILPAINKISITNNDIFLQPGEFAILTPDTNKFPYYSPSKFFQVKFSALGNTNDGFIVYDYRGLTIDSLLYNSKWGGTKGYSLERISLSASSTDSTNWTTSLNPDGATPGNKNSLSNLRAYNKGSLIINEIMYDPSTGNSEFVEFYNNSSDSLQLGGTTLQFGMDKKINISSVYNLIAPKKYFLLAADSTVYNNYPILNSNKKVVELNSALSLSNEGSRLVIKDARGSTLDSLLYLSQWHNKNIISAKNKTLERLNPSLNSNDRANWNTSVAVEGATPLQANSIFTSTVISESKATILPNPFSPDGDGFEDFATINFSLKQPLAQVRMKVFDSQGRLVRTIAHNHPSGPNNSIIFDGLDDNGRPLRIGIYILLIEIVTNSGETEILKLPVVIARKL